MLRGLLLAAAMFPVSLTALEMELKPPLEYRMSMPAFSQELYVFGLSYHFNRDYDYNEQNPGLGYAVEFFTPNPNKSVSAGWTAAMGTYKDSYNEQAYFVGFGPRITWGQRDDWHTTAGLLLSYLDGSGNKGFAAIPILSIDYDHVGLGITGVPMRGNTDHASEVIAVFLKFTLDTN